MASRNVNGGIGVDVCLDGEEKLSCEQHRQRAAGESRGWGVFDE